VEGKLSSSVGFKGIIKKVTIFIIVAVAHLVDGYLGAGAILINASIFFYASNELLSIIENSGRIGLPVPTLLKKAVEVLKDKSEANQ
jgi:toxin secretion/phage lysis holin